MRRYARTHAWRAGLAAAAAIVGCGGREPVVEDGSVTDGVYVAVMTRLLLLDASPPGGSSVAARRQAADSVRAEILDSLGVTAEDVLHFAAAAGDEPGRMEVLWAQITHAYDSARAIERAIRTEVRSEPAGKLGEAADPVTGDPAPGSTNRSTDSVASTRPTDSSGLAPVNPRKRRPRRPGGPDRQR